jgi:hypothetical protein
MDSERMAFIGNYENKKTLKHLAWNGNKQVENLTLENSTKIMMPTDPFYEENGIKKADIWVNFNGVQFAPRWAKEMKKTVLVNVELGEGSDVYKKRFEVAGVFRKVMEAILENIENKTGENITLGRVGLSSWSAGYGAIESILSHQEFKKKIDAVMILDGLHGAYEGTDDGETMSLNDSYMNDIADFARNAANDERLFFGLTHSSIVPPNYPSTTENARWLTWQLGGDEPKVNAPFIATGLRKISSFENGGAFIDGYAGMDEDAHCAMFQTMPKLLKKVKKVGFE